jgi:hypothetical protein
MPTYPATKTPISKNPTVAEQQVKKTAPAPAPAKAPTSVKTPPKSVVTPAKTVSTPKAPAPAPAKKTPTAGATSGKAGAVGAAVPPVSPSPTLVTSAQGTGAGSSTNYQATNTQDVSTNGAADLSGGTLDQGTFSNNQIGAFQAGEQTQAAADYANASTQQAAPASPASTGFLSGILGGNGKTLLIAAGVGGLGFWFYRRQKSGKPIFPASSTESE